MRARDSGLRSLIGVVSLIWANLADEQQVAGRWGEKNGILKRLLQLLLLLLLEGDKARRGGWRGEGLEKEFKFIYI